jgi:cyclophilin family peptidyl-prolyl cis-trans isomerase
VPRTCALLAILAASILLAACGKDAAVDGDADAGTQSTATTATQTTTTGKRATPKSKVPARSRRDGCKAVAAARPINVPKRKVPTKRLSTDRVWTVVMRTNCGTIFIRLSAASWPKTTASFAGLVRAKFFDGLSFHRIAKPGGVDYVIQGGDPLGNGNGGPGYTTYETPPSTTTYPRYTVAMAKSQDERPGTSGSQFFIVTGSPGAQLGPDYAVLGRVSAGQDVVRRIARVATDPATEMPVDPVVMSSVRLRSKPQPAG